MIFHSFQFLWLFPIIFVGYYAITSIWRGNPARRTRIANLLLLAISYGVYAQQRPAMTLVLLGVTAVTYLSALIIERHEAYGCKKYIIWSCATLALIPLLVFKYFGAIKAAFFPEIEGFNFVVRLGISFYTFQAVGYLFDVYRRRIHAEHDWWDYMLFVSFFPQILAGPISRAADLLPQIKANRTFSFEQAVSGLKLFIWGMFLKVALADRLGLYVDPIIDNFSYHSGISCLYASLFFSFQIYGDFAGYSFMAMGVGRLLGFNLIQNFRQPFLAISISDLWRRWHISLSTWLRDYVYIPLGGSRCSRWRCYGNILVTFFVSGIWHGSNLTYVVWGLLQGCLQIIEKALGLQQCKSRSWWVIAPRIIATFLAFSFTMIFFKMPSLGDACSYITQIFTTPGTLFVPAMTCIGDYLLPLVIVVLADIYFEWFRSPKPCVGKIRTAINVAALTAVTSLTLLLAVNHSTKFIYLGF